MRNYSVQVFDQFLCDFAGQLHKLGLNDIEMRLVEQSRVAYLDEMHQKEMRSSEKQTVMKLIRKKTIR